MRLTSNSTINGAGLKSSQKVWYVQCYFGLELHIYIHEFGLVTNVPYEDSLVNVKIYGIWVQLLSG